MRFKLYKDNEERVKKVFAWFPITARYERRWLEICYIQQKYTEGESPSAGEWTNLFFVGKLEYNNYRKQEREVKDFKETFRV